MDNFRLRKKRNDTAVQDDEALQRLFGSSPSFLQLIRQQRKRLCSGPTKKYEDIDKATAFTMYYKCGKKGYE